MSQDLYELLGVDRDADADTIKKAYRRLARQYHPDVNPDPETQERFKEISRRLRGALRPAEAGVVRPRRRPVRRRRRRLRPGRRLLVHRHHGRLLRRRCRRRGGPRPAPARAARPGRADPARGRPRRGGVRRDPRAEGRHRRPVRHLPGRGDRAGHPSRAVRDLPRRRRGGARAALVPRRDPHPAAVRGLPRLRHDHPRAVPGVLRRRPGPLAPHPDRQDPGRRRHRHPRPARRRGRGRPRRWSGGRPVRRDPRRPARDLHPRTAATCTARSRCR